MKKFVFGLMVLVIIGAFVACGRNGDSENGNGANGNGATAPNPPSLYIENAAGERFGTIRLTTSWSFFDGDGNFVVGVNSDSPHPLQLHLREFENAATITLRQNEQASAQNKRQYFGLSFLYGEPLRAHSPHGISVTRWRAEYAEGNQDIGEVLGRGETVAPINPSYPEISNPERFYALLPIFDDGNDYIYMVEAEWQEGRATFTFRVNSGQVPFRDTEPGYAEFIVPSSRLPSGFAGFSLILHEMYILEPWEGNSGFFRVPIGDEPRYSMRIAQLTDYASAEEWVYSIIERAYIEAEILKGVGIIRPYEPPTAEFPFFAMERNPASEEGHLMQHFARDNGKGGVFLITIFLPAEEWDGHGERLLQSLATFEVLAG